MPISERRARQAGELYLSPEARWAVIRAEEELTLWDLEAAMPVRQLAPSTERIPAVVVTAAGKIVAPRQVLRQSYLVDLATGKTLRGIDETRINIAAAFSAGGKRLIGSATGYGDVPVGIWDVETSKAVLSASDSPGAVALSRCNRYAVYEILPDKVRIWDLETKTALPPLSGHTSRVTAVAVTEHAKWIATGSIDQTVKLWRDRQSEGQQTFAGHTGGISSVAITPGGRLILSGSRDGTLRLWLRDKSEPLASFEAAAPIANCGITADGHSIVANDSEGAIYFLHWES